jgi:HK97 gp10 family phage protein
VGWHIKFNHFGAVAVEMKKRIDDEVDDAAQALALELKSTLWRDTGLVRRVTVNKPQGLNHAEVWIGYNRGQGFYSRFQEWGTIKQAARPIVGPAADALRPRYVEEMGHAISEAADAQ